MITTPRRKRTARATSMHTNVGSSQSGAFEQLVAYIRDTWGTVLIILAGDVVEVRKNTSLFVQCLESHGDLCTCINAHAMFAAILNLSSRERSIRCRECDSSNVERGTRSVELDAEPTLIGTSSNHNSSLAWVRRVPSWPVRLLLRVSHRFYIGDWDCGALGVSAVLCAS